MKRHGRLILTVFSLVILANGCKRSNPAVQAPPVPLPVKTPDNLTRINEPPLPLTPDAMLLAPATPVPTPAPPAPLRARRPSLWQDFNGQLAFADACKFVALGPRVAGSEALDRERTEIAAQLASAGWQVGTEAFSDQGPEGNEVDFRSLRARFPGVQRPAKRFLVAAHFDTERSSVVHLPGATDGAAGPAILLEIARVLAAYPQVASEVELLFLDGNHPFRQSMARDGLFGSRFDAQMLQMRERINEVRAMIDIENLGGKDFRLFYAPTSDPDLVASFQHAARALGIPLAPASRPILGDQVPFQQANVPALALLDAESPYLHTADDNIDRLDPASLAKVGQLVLYVLTEEVSPSGI